MDPTTPWFTRFLRLWATLLRFLGGFPYVWDRCGTGVFPGLRRRTTFQTWPWILGMLYACSIIMPMASFFINWDDNHSNSSTMDTLLDLYRISEATASVLLYVHILKGRENLGELLSHLDISFPEYVAQNWKCFRDKGFVAIVVNHILLTLPLFRGQIKLAIRESEAFGIAAAIMRNIFFLLTLIIISMQILSSYLLTSFLNNVLTDILDVFKFKTTPNDNLVNGEIIQRQSLESGSVKTKMSSVVGLDNVERNEWTRDSGHVERQFDVSYERRARSDISIMTTYKKVHKVYEFQLLLNEYFSVPALALMSLAVVWLITDSYIYLTIAKDWMKLTSYAPYFLFSATNVIAFCWPTEALRKKVRNLHFTLSGKRIAAVTNPELQNLISYSLELLDHYPGFDVGGFYTAGKAQIVSIISFIMTYIVILSQFKLADTEEADTRKKVFMTME